MYERYLPFDEWLRFLPSLHDNRKGIEDIGRLRELFNSHGYLAHFKIDFPSDNWTWKTAFASCLIS